MYVPTSLTSGRQGGTWFPLPVPMRPCLLGHCAPPTSPAAVQPSVLSDFPVPLLSPVSGFAPDPRNLPAGPPEAEALFSDPSVAAAVLPERISADKHAVTADPGQLSFPSAPRTVNSPGHLPGYLAPCDSAQSHLRFVCVSVQSQPFSSLCFYDRLTQARPGSE